MCFNLPQISQLTKHCAGLKIFFLTNQAACLNKTKNTDRINVQGKQEGSDKIRGECHEEENHASRPAKN